MKLVARADEKAGYRIPTGAEWEFACRAGATTAYFFGEPWELLEKYAWYGVSERTASVGSLKPNDLGLFDVHGNLWEWCQDRSAGESRQPDSPKDAGRQAEVVRNDARRLIRGGTFYVQPVYVRTDNIDWLLPTERSNSVGMRPVRTHD
jgi:formylglycine-generating enzyme required for sulfatase activity